MWLQTKGAQPPDRNWNRVRSDHGRNAFLRAAIPALALVGIGLGVVLAGERTGSAGGEPSDGCEPSVAGQAFRNLPAPYAPSADTDIVHIRISGNEFRVPRNYFRHPPIGCGVDEPGMLLRVLLPKMKGYTEENGREIEGLKEPGWGRKMNIMVQTFERLSGYTPATFQVFTSGVDPTAAYPRKHGLLYTPNRRRAGGPRSAIDVFFDRDNGDVTRFIVCKGVTAVPYPSCQHRFVYESLRVKATYDRSRLASWAEIESKIRDLLDQFGLPLHD